ncbi:hypothetical protein GCM10009727_62520 [Actinomadura napierensis]|uniref:Uncharacterized protein n=1 Tax=Actinomadura napierensis TaxID=267854 RepID=A0ABP5M1K4_9ACTN
MKVLVMLPTRTRGFAGIGRPVRRSATPLARVHVPAATATVRRSARRRLGFLVVMCFDARHGRGAAQ